MGDVSEGYATPPTTPERCCPATIGPCPPRPRRKFNINSENGSDERDGKTRHDDHCSTPGSGTPIIASMVENLSVLTWNVWFGELRQEDRYASILSTVLTLDPDIACFQEVNRTFLRTLQSTPNIHKRYQISSNPIYESYGILSLARRGLGATFEEIELPTQMGRNLLMTRIPSARLPSANHDGNDTKSPFVVVGNVHLESLDNAALRRQQLVICNECLRENEPVAALLVGDFNFDSEQAWGDWKKPVQHRQPADKLENKVLNDVMPEWVDAWPHLKQQGKGSGDPGITFDGATNPLCITDEQERMRYDRIMVYLPAAQEEKGTLLVPESIEMVGTEAIDETGLKASDHYGLIIKLRSKCESATAVGMKTTGMIQTKRPRLENS